jgi:hypothetical protein
MSRASRAEWAKRVERWRDSGLTAKQFASETGVKASTLSFWSWRLRADGGRGAVAVTKGRAGRPDTRRQPPRRAAGPSKFVELAPSAAVPALAAALEVVLSCGVVVRVPAGFDEATLGRVVRALGAAR